MVKRNNLSSKTRMQEWKRESDGHGLQTRGKAKADRSIASQGRRILMSTPRQDFKLTPWRNCLRAFWDSRSRARILVDETGRHTTETVETYIRLCLRMDNLQWAECLEDNRKALVELFSGSGRHALGAGDGNENGNSDNSNGAGAEDNSDVVSRTKGSRRGKDTAEKAQNLRRLRSERARASADARLVEQIRVREDFARELVAMEQARVSEFILQYWRVFRHFNKAGEELPVIPKLPDEADFSGERLYRAYVTKLRKEVAGGQRYTGVSKENPLIS